MSTDLILPYAPKACTHFCALSVDMHSVQPSVHFDNFCVTIQVAAHHGPCHDSNERAHGASEQPAKHAVCGVPVRRRGQD